MTPVQMAKGMIETHGLDKAVMLADTMVHTSEEVTTSGGTPFSHEIELFMGDDGKEHIRIDEGKKAVRLSQTQIFWKNVFGFVKNRKLEDTAKKIGKKS